MKAKLILENGSVFEGKVFGHRAEDGGEVVFHTGMAGYQEIVTDPSYYGQMVVMTYPLIGNYGINLEDMESEKPAIKGLIVKERCKKPSNWRCEMDLETYLRNNKIIGLEDIDTRALTRELRNFGAMKGIITLEEATEEEIQTKISNLNNHKVVEALTTKTVKKIEGEGHHIAVMDFGVKKSFLKALSERGCKLTILPATATAEEIVALQPDGILLSNGPGNPKELEAILPTIKELLGKKPIFGIGLGHQLLALSLGGDTETLKYGHRGHSHPVKDIINKKVYSTMQSHGYVVKEATLPKEVIVTHRSLNDGTLEGMMHKDLLLLSVQFHPETILGLKEEEDLFNQFIEMLKGGKGHA